MKIRFQADADLNRHIINAVLRLEPAMDFQSAQNANLLGLTDPQVLKYAADRQRILVSHDQRTMPKHFAEFINHHRSYGVVIVPKRLSVLDVSENIVLIYEVLTAEDWINRIAFLPL
ncbi:MAG: hypothetical protein RLZZ568_2267 [Cyanobacteriota bacterium]|jgi:hypothetical protein